MILLAAAIWGFAEATLFFIVPDVLLTFAGLTSFKRALWCSLAALLGALAGGAILFQLSRHDPEHARAILDRVPGIQQPLLESVGADVQKWGLIAVLFGPLEGKPYKIYAVEEAAKGASLLGFGMISLLGRYVRFFLSAGLGALLGRLLSKFMDLPRQRAWLGGCWTVFYALYFWRFGW